RGAPDGEAGFPVTALFPPVTSLFRSNCLPEIFPVPVPALLRYVIVITTLSAKKQAETRAIFPASREKLASRRRLDDARERLGRATSRRAVRRRRKCPCRRGRTCSSPSGGPTAAWARARSPWRARAPVRAPG